MILGEMSFKLFLKLHAVEPFGLVEIVSTVVK